MSNARAVQAGELLTRRRRFVYLLVLSALTALAPLTIDMYLPAFPSIQRDLLTTPAAIQATLSATTVGFAIGQLVVGPWSDRVGRKLPLTITTALHVIASVGVALAPSVPVLLLTRALEGAGTAAGTVIAVAMTRDMFNGYPLVRTLARLSLVAGVAPVFSPVLGSGLLQVISWRGMFILIAAFGALTFIAALAVLPETMTRVVPTSQMAHPFARYKVLIGDRTFLTTAAVSACVFAALFAYLSSSSLLFQKLYAVSAAQYGIIFAINSVGLIIGAQTAARVARRISPRNIVLGGTSMLALTGGGILIASTLAAQFFVVLALLWFFVAAVGICLPSLQVLALLHHPESAGTAAALLGAGNFIVGGVVAPVVGLFGLASIGPMALVMTVGGLVALALTVAKLPSVHLDGSAAHPF